MSVITAFTSGATPGYVKIESDWASLITVEDSIDITWTGWAEMRGVQIGIQMADGTLGTPGTFGVGTSGVFDLDIGTRQNGPADGALENAATVNVSGPTVFRQANRSINRVRCIPTPVIDEGTMTQYRLVVGLYLL